MIKDILKDSILYLSSKVFVAILNMYIIYLILHEYGNDIYAKYSITLLIALTVSNFTSTWLSQALLRKFDDCKNKTSFISFSFIIINVVSFFIIYIYGLLNNIDNTYTAILLSISQSVYSLGRVFLQKNRKIKSFFIYDSVRMFTIFLIIQLGVITKVNIIIVAYILGNMIFIIPIYKILFNFKLKFESFKSIGKEWFRFGFPVGIWLTIASGQLLIDRELINHFFGLSSGGLYSYYYDLIAKTCSLIIIPMSNAIYPILVEKENDIKDYNKISFNICMVSFSLSVFIATLLYYLYPILNIFYEINFERINLSFLIYGILLWQLGLLYQKPLEMMNRTSTMVINLFICLVISTLVNIYIGFNFSPECFSFTVAISATIYLILTYSTSTTSGKK